MRNRFKQMNITFNPVEDRLLLKMTAGEPGSLAEYRFWLTRRFVMILWKAFDKILGEDESTGMQISPVNINAIKQFQQEAVLSKADFTTSYATDEIISTPLGPKPLLVSKIQIKKGPAGQQTLSLLTPDYKSINLDMDNNLIYSIRKLLAEAAKKAEWSIPFLFIPDETEKRPQSAESMN